MKLSAGETPVQSPVPENAESTPMTESPMPTAEAGAAAAESAEQKPKKSGREERGRRVERRWIWND